MPIRARLYIAGVCVGGAAVLGYSLLNWHTSSWIEFAIFCAINLFAARLKVRLPGVLGTMSMNFFFVLVAIAALTSSETVALGCLGIAAQTIFGAAARPRLVQVLFNVASMALSAAIGVRVFHLEIWQTIAMQASLRLVLAAVAFFLCNTLSVAVVIALTEGKPAWRVWRGSYFGSLPYYLAGSAMATLLSPSSHWVDWQTSLLILPVVYVLYRSHQLYINRLEEAKHNAEERQRHAEEVSALHRRTITALALAIEAKDETTHDHLERVETYAVELGKELGLNNSELEALRASAVLHDIGKLAVPEYIISKPGRLTPDEFEKMKVHPVVGAEIVEFVQFPYAVAPIVRAHHEKWDGSGYPDGLVGEEIPIGARILAAVDCLDALASDRQYRRALPLEEAIAVVRKEAGRSFDPRVVEVLGRRYVELERLAKAGIARRKGSDKPKLSTTLRVERGVAPAAGFAGSGTATHHDLSALNRVVNAHYSSIAEQLRELVPFDVIVLYEVRGDSLISVWQDGEPAAAREVHVGTGLSGWVAATGRSIVNGNPSVEPGFFDARLQSALAAPLAGSAGGAQSIAGVIALYHRDRDAFANEHLEVLARVAPLLAGQFSTKDWEAAAVA
jgi:putative nucleotidyltransferase with HDIG domain